jgi:cell division protease FtsH
MQNKTRMIMISERLIKEETLEGPLFESLFNQPINDDQYEMPSILAGMPGINLSGGTEQGKLLPEPGVTQPVNQQFQEPLNGDLN